MIVVTALEGQLAVVVRQVCELIDSGCGGVAAAGRGVVAAGCAIIAACGSAVASAAGGCRRGCVAAAFVVSAGVAEIDIVSDHLSGVTTVAVPVGVVAGLEFALHNGHAALGEEPGDELAGLTPGNDIDEML